MCHKILAGKRILIVENDIPSRVLLEIILEELGCSFETAVNGQEGVDKVRQKEFNIVLMDVRMPFMTGYEATKKIRETYKDLPIIALTAHAIDGVQGKCLEAGMTDYLIKPFEQEQLVAMLLKWINKK